MDDLPFTPIELVAIDGRRNVRRHWRIAASRDLFGQVMIETGWGRIGEQGRMLVRSFSAEAEALRYVRALLARRGTAMRRIGVGYRPATATRPHVDRDNLSCRKRYSGKSIDESIHNCFSGDSVLHRS